MAEVRVAADNVRDHEFPVLDPGRSNLCLLVGRKGSGKSVAARALFRSYPFDKVAVDVNGDADPGEDAQRVRAPLPGRFPVGEDRAPKTLWFRADPGDPAYRDDIDRAIGLALKPSDRHCMVWLDEIGEVTTGNTCPPMLRRLLMQSRHYSASALMCGPRPVNINPLCVSQADYVYIYALPNPKDRERLADNMGYPAARLEAEMRDTAAQGPFWFNLWDARTNTLWQMPPMPDVGHTGPRA